MDKKQFEQEINKLYKQQNWQQMLQLCEQGLKNFPQSASTYHNRAIAKANLGFLKEAKEDLEKSLQIRPEQPQAQQFLIKIQQELKTPSLSPSQFFKQNKKDLIELLDPSQEIKQFGRYKILEEVGRGGMGKVYKAYDSKLEREIALKVIVSGSLAGRKEIDRFSREAKSTAALKHPNIISVYDTGVENGCPYFTMDLIVGVSLKEHLQKSPRDIQKIIKIMVNVGEAVHYANENKVIHRDIKPANIMIDENHKPLVMDFGLAKLTGEEELSKTGDVLGTPAYMSPEQAQGQNVDARTDVYALGATLYEILTGRPPFKGETNFKIIDQILHSDPILPRTLNPEVAIELEAICLKSLEKKAEKRYHNVKMWTQDLENFLAHKPILAKPPTVLNSIQKLIWRNKRVSFLLLVALCSILFAFVFLYQGLHIAKAKEQQERELRKKIQKEKGKAITLGQKKEIEKQIAISNEIEILLINSKGSIKERDYEKAKKPLKRIEFLIKSNPIAYKDIKPSEIKQFYSVEKRRKWLQSTFENTYKYCILPNAYNKKSIRQDFNFTWSNGIYSQYGHRISFYQKKDLVVYDFYRNKNIHRLQNVPLVPPIYRYAFSKDGNSLAWGDYAGTRLYFWDFRKQSLVEKKIKGNKKTVKNMQFSSDGKFFAYTTKKYFLIWDVVRKKAVFEYLTEAFGVHYCAFSWDGKWLAISASLGLYLFELDNIKSLQLPHPVPIKADIMRFTEDTTLIATDRNQIAIHPQLILSHIKKISNEDVFSESIPFRLAAEHQNEIRNLAISPHQNIFVSAGDKNIIIWSMQSFDKLLRFPIDGVISGGTHPRVLFPHTTRKIFVLTSKLISYSWETHYQKNLDLLANLNPLEKKVLKKVRILTQISKAFVGDFSEFVFSPDGKLLACYFINKLYLWNLEDKQPQLLFQEHIITASKTVEKETPVFRSDGKFLLFAQRLWKIENARATKVDIKKYSKLRNVKVFTPKFIFCLNRSWHIKKDFVLTKIERRGATSIALSPSKKTLLRALNGLIEIWDYQKFPKVVEYWHTKEKIKGIVQAMHFYAENKIAVADTVGAFYLYDISNTKKPKKLYQAQFKHSISKIYYNSANKMFWLVTNQGLLIYPLIEDREKANVYKIDALYPLPIYPAYKTGEIAISPDFKNLAIGDAGNITLFRLHK